MKNKKTLIIAACIIVVAAVGIILSPMIDWPVDSDKSSGDIGKAERFSRENTEPISNMQELLLNDSAYKDGIVASYVVMQTRAQQFDALVEMSNEAVGSLNEFADVLSQLNDNREMIGNVCEQLNTAGDNLEAVLDGEDSPEVEQNTINAALAYTTLQKQNQLADKFIETADNYLKKNSGSDQLKLVRDSWVDYQQMTAALDGDSKAAEALDKKGYQLTPEQNVAAMAESNIGFRLHMMMSAALANNLGARNHVVEAYTGEKIDYAMNCLRLGAIRLKNGSTVEEINALMMRYRENPSQLEALLSSEQLGSAKNSEVLAGARNSEVLASLKDADVFNMARLIIGQTDNDDLGGRKLRILDKAELGDKAVLSARLRNSTLNAFRLFSGSQVMDSYNLMLKGFRATASALNAQESLAMRLRLRSGISNVISATAMGLRNRNATTL